MPSDDFVECFHHDERMNAGILHRRLGGVAESQSPDDDVEVVIDRLGQAEARERYLGRGEQARHQELVAELYFVDIDVEGRLDPPAQADGSDGGLGPVENLELTALGSLTFQPVDLERYPAFGLITEAGRRGGTYAAVASAVDDVAVDRFIKGRAELLAREIGAGHQDCWPR
ncbi:MAG: hypothetical protein HY239_08135 [Mycolicibacterium aromaticivorans]|nr:hypothetical protein [Mycolicibacterium aromaticivorans]